MPLFQAPEVRELSKNLSVGKIQVSTQSNFNIPLLLYNSTGDGKNREQQTHSKLSASHTNRRIPSSTDEHSKHTSSLKKIHRSRAAEPS